MREERLREILNDFRLGKIELDDLLITLRFFPYEDLGFSKIDTHRSIRKGFPEVVFSKGKEDGQIIKIVERLLATGEKMVLITKANAKLYDSFREIREDVVYYETARMILIGKPERDVAKGTILVLTGGTSDIPIAEEAAVTSEIMGNNVERIYDVGVAGVHRLLDHKEMLIKADIIIVVAGMEGALASVVGGMVECPIIAVPTSVGYGASFNGLAALLTMLNSCAPGVVVVNIDNGFGAGYFASLIIRQRR